MMDIERRGCYEMLVLRYKHVLITKSVNSINIALNRVGC